MCNGEKYSSIEKDCETVKSPTSGLSWLACAAAICHSSRRETGLGHRRKPEPQCDAGFGQGPGPEVALGQAQFSPVVMIVNELTTNATSCPVFGRTFSNSAQPGSAASPDCPLNLRAVGWSWRFRLPRTSIEARPGIASRRECAAPADFLRVPLQQKKRVRSGALL
jgi:hypothetical protein